MKSSKYRRLTTQWQAWRILKFITKGEISKNNVLKFESLGGCGLCHHGALLLVSPYSEWFLQESVPHPLLFSILLEVVWTYHIAPSVSEEWHSPSRFLS